MHLNTCICPSPHQSMEHLDHPSSEQGTLTILGSTFPEFCTRSSIRCRRLFVCFVLGFGVQQILSDKCLNATLSFLLLLAKLPTTTDYSVQVLPGVQSRLKNSWKWCSEGKTQRWGHHPSMTAKRNPPSPLGCLLEKRKRTQRRRKYATKH